MAEKKGRKRDTGKPDVSRPTAKRTEGRKEAEPERSLTLLQVLLLTFVSSGLTSSYDLISQAGISVGITSPALKALQHSGYLKRTTGARNRIDFSLTDRGEQALHTSLEDGRRDFWASQGADGDYDSISRSALILWFHFGPEEANRCIEHGISRLRSRVKRMELEGYEVLHGTAAFAVARGPRFASFCSFLKIQHESRIIESEIRLLERTGKFLIDDKSLFPNSSLAGPNAG